MTIWKGVGVLIVFAVAVTNVGSKAKDKSDFATATLMDEAEQECEKKFKSCMKQSTGLGIAPCKSHFADCNRFTKILNKSNMKLKKHKPGFGAPKPTTQPPLHGFGAPKPATQPPLHGSGAPKTTTQPPLHGPAAPKSSAGFGAPIPKSPQKRITTKADNEILLQNATGV